MKNVIHHFPTCYACSVKKPVGELNLESALDEDTGPGAFPLFHHLLHGSDSCLLESTLHQCTFHDQLICIGFVQTSKACFSHMYFYFFRYLYLFCFVLIHLLGLFHIQTSE